MRRIKKIFVHHSASPAATTTTERIDKWHKERGWNGIGYHFVIHLDGSVHQGRPIHKTGAHVKNHNTGTIGICVCGNFMEEVPSDAQLLSLDLLIRGLMAKYKVPIHHLYGHREMGATECPGDNLFKKLVQWRDDNGQ